MAMYTGEFRQIQLLNTGRLPQLKESIGETTPQKIILKEIKFADKNKHINNFKA